jgi:hypothetical protein
VRSRALRRDLGLAARMALALLLLATTYAPLVAGVGWLVVYRPGYAVYWSLVGLALAAAFVTTTVRTGPAGQRLIA